MGNQEKKGVVGSIIRDLVQSTKLQHEITKERHAYAKKPPIEKQKMQLKELQKRNDI